MNDAASLSLEDLLPCSLPPLLPLSVVNVFTWPDPATRFVYEADPMETGGELKAKLAAHIGYLALDVVIRKENGTELIESESLSGQGLCPGEEVRIVRRSKLPQGAGVGGQLGALVPSSASLERLPQSAFALSCVKDYPRKPVLLRMLQLNHGMLPDLRAPCVLEGCAPAQELESLLHQIGSQPENQTQAAYASVRAAAGVTSQAVSSGLNTPMASVFAPVSTPAASSAHSLQETPHSTLAELAGHSFAGKNSENMKLDDIFDQLIDWDSACVSECLLSGDDLAPAKRCKLEPSLECKVEHKPDARVWTADTDRSASSEAGDDHSSSADSSPSEEAMPSGSWAQHPSSAIFEDLDLRLD